MKDNDYKIPEKDKRRHAGKIMIVAEIFRVNTVSISMKNM